jgi:hypothetical protein
MIRCSERAVTLLRTASDAARRFNPDACIRLVAEADAVRFELAEAPEAGEQIVEHGGGFTLIVAAGLSGTVDVVDPHDRLVLIPDGVTTGSGP